MPIQLFDKETGAKLGEITAEQLEQLGEFLEAEEPDDHDYWINPEVLDYMEEEGVDADVITLLRAAIRSDEGVEITWKDA